MMNLKDKLYESKITRPLILSLDILIGASAIGGCGGSAQDRANPKYDHPTSINVDGNNVEIYDGSEIFDSLPEEAQKELYGLEVEARQQLILAYGHTRSPQAKVKVDSLIKERDRVLYKTLQPVSAEWKYHRESKDLKPTITFKYNRLYR